MENSNNELVCSICNSSVKEDDEVCEKCGADLSEFEENSLAENKYPSLKSLSGIYKFLAFLVSSEGIIWMIDLENNSRVQIKLLYKLLKRKAN